MGSYFKFPVVLQRLEIVLLFLSVFSLHFTNQLSISEKSSGNVGSDSNNATDITTMAVPQEFLQDAEENGLFYTMEKLPCSDLPGHAFHNATQKCYPLGMKGPCPDLMKFYADPENEGFGDCDCLSMRNCIGRPRTYWPSTNKCYFVYSRGPCKPGKWLVFNKNRKPECQPNPCGRKEKNQPTEFWFHHDGTCYRTGTQAFCQPDETVYISSSDLKPRCYTTKPVCRFLLFAAQTLSCRTGSKLDVTGKCAHMRDLESDELLE